MSYPTDETAGVTTWIDPKGGKPYSVIVAADFGVTQRALKSWDHYKDQLGVVQQVLVSFSGINGLPYSDHDLARFVALGSTGSALALSGANCGYGGEGPHGTAKILEELGISKDVAGLVFSERDLRFVRLKDGWLAEIGNQEATR